MVDPVVQRLFRRADEVRTQLGIRGIRPFVASQYEEVHEVLKGLVTDEPQVFLEWGSATGAITILADLLGFEAYGVEIEPDYVEAARKLAEEFDSGAEFLEGSFIPREFDDAEDSETLALGLPDAYDDHVVAIDDADVIYAFPWPDDRDVYLAVFHRYARPGAVFVSFDTDRFTIVRRPGSEEEELLPDGFPL
jgi:SAM-dependent methyltransferase